ncbi:hypothetical protein [Candidatus Nitrospira nitrificans]|uniref:Uncharacterized protein n=1 Tax=Candidatus Nitrospira nitrificans TaxID=1742973 RepID=A0A0S4L967_9BACT|nr:hypothetical protein [Candidatus Nitrospira nitrificans]CUS34037.1 conserved hypothetical protein [Candidatus Nitrospira nitrificans]
MARCDRITAEEVGQSPDFPRGRVAVVLIHGIGDQQPMNTLRELIKGLYLHKEDQTPEGGKREERKPHVFSKPDRMSEVLDLRRMAAGKEVTGKPADFYELYWAHLMQGSTLAHVGDWFFTLLWRLPSEVPGRLRLIWWGSWGMVVAAGAGALYQAVTGRAQETVFAAGLVGLVLYGGRGMFRKVALGYLADAARYLRPAPENIAVRQSIRNAGLEVLRKLHDEPMQRYDRIIVVGHSLGSVIAYDILTHLWQEMHWIHSKPSEPKQAHYEAMRKRLEACAGSAGELKSFRVMQKALGEEERSLGMPWKVTDLITLGSPLAYADYLLADRKYDMADRKQDRELPSCPPQLDDRRDIDRLSNRYKLSDGTWSEKEKTKKLLHHAALFACTRWTNIFFAADMIGGKLAHLFGTGIHDVPLDGTRCRGKTWLAHVRYWNHAEPAACIALKNAMALDEPYCHEPEAVQVGGREP